MLLLKREVLIKEINNIPKNLHFIMLLLKQEEKEDDAKI